MKTITITAMALTAFAIASTATLSSTTVSRALAGADDLSQLIIPADQATALMPVYQMMANAKDLPEQSFETF